MRYRSSWKVLIDINEIFIDTYEISEQPEDVYRYSSIVMRYLSSRTMFIDIYRYL